MACDVNFIESKYIQNNNTNNKEENLELVQLSQKIAFCIEGLCMLNTRRPSFFIPPEITTAVRFAVYNKCTVFDCIHSWKNPAVWAEVMKSNSFSDFVCSEFNVTSPEDIAGIKLRIVTKFLYENAVDQEKKNPDINSDLRTFLQQQHQKYEEITKDRISDLVDKKDSGWDRIRNLVDKKYGGWDNAAAWKSCSYKLIDIELPFANKISSQVCKRFMHDNPEIGTILFLVGASHIPILEEDDLNETAKKYIPPSSRELAKETLYKQELVATHTLTRKIKVTPLIGIKREVNLVICGGLHGSTKHLQNLLETAKKMGLSLPPSSFQYQSTDLINRCKWQYNRHEDSIFNLVPKDHIKFISPQN